MWLVGPADDGKWSWKLLMMTPKEAHTEEHHRMVVSKLQHSPQLRTADEVEMAFLVSTNGHSSWYRILQNQHGHEGLWEAISLLTIVRRVA